MPSPKIKTFREITPLIYSWTTPDIPKYAGWEKIGYTEQESADARIAQQASQLSVEKKKLWSRRALFTSEAGGRFTDKDFHAYLHQQGVERETTPKRTEWHHFEIAPKTSLEYFNDFAGQDFPNLPSSGGEDDYVLRPEQQAAVDQAVAAFEAGKAEVLWNAKPRFGKTLTTYDLMRTLDVRRVLIVTNRPAIANSWFDDFTRFIGHQTTYRFVSESPSLAGRSPMTREQWRAFSLNHLDEDPRIVEFLSLQDLKGSQYFGGSYDKLKHIAQFDWDLLVIDEAHEGIDTTKTDVAFDQIKRKWTLHLSGTPFKALASGKFDQDQIFNWTYEDEQAARQQWEDDGQENPYAALPTLNLLTYQISRMITDRLAEGVAIDEDEANIDYTFDLNEFFATKDNGFFEHEAEVIKFLDCLATNEKYPFSTPELRDEIRHSFWLLNRVASAKALERLLKKHDVFKDYTVVLAAGDGRSDDDTDPVAAGKSLDKVRTAIAEAEKSDGKTITLSVGQLTTGVTVPEWTAVIMLSNLSSPAQYMQAAFRAQNPCTFERAGHVFQKQNAYIFDFAPERTLTIFDAFANNLHPNPSGDQGVRQENIRTLLNFFPVLGEDAEGRMIELDASQVLTFPQVFKAREVVRRGFLSNLLFANVAGIFRYSEHVKEILDKLPTAKQGKVTNGQPIEIPQPPPVTDPDGNVQVDVETVINPKVAELGKPVWSIEDIPTPEPDAPAHTAATQIAKAVTEQSRQKREELKEAYGLTAKQVERDEKRTEQAVKDQVERAYTEHNIASKHLEDELKNAATEAEAQAVEAKRAEQDKAFKANILAIVERDDGLDRARGGHPRGDQEGAEAREPDDGRRPLPPARLRPHDPHVPHGVRGPRHPPVELRRLHARRRVRGDHRDHRSRVPPPARRPGGHRGERHRHEDPGPVRRGGLRPGRPGVPGQEGGAGRLLRRRADREHLRLHPAAEDVSGLHPAAGREDDGRHPRGREPGHLHRPDQDLRGSVLHRRTVPDGTRAPSRHGPCRRRSRTRTTGCGTS